MPAEVPGCGGSTTAFLVLTTAGRLQLLIIQPYGALLRISRLFEPTGVWSTRTVVAPKGGSGKCGMVFEYTVAHPEGGQPQRNSARGSSRMH